MSSAPSPTENPRSRPSPAPSLAVALERPSAVEKAASPLALVVSVGRLHIVTIAMLGALTFGWLFTGVHPWLAVAVCGFDWFLVNLLNRVVDLREDRANGIVGTGLVERHRSTIALGGLLALALSFVLVHAIAPALTPLRAAYHGLGLVYNWPLLPQGRRVKQLYFWKNTASATGFMLTVFAYPLAAAGWPSHFPPGISVATIVTSGVFFFLFELSYEVIYDLRDVEGDAIAQVASYPVVHGVPGAVRIVDALIAASAAALVVGYVTGVVPWRIFVMVAAPAIQLAVYKHALRRGLRASDCINLTWLGAGLLLAYHLWIAAGLPGVR